MKALFLAVVVALVAAPAALSEPAHVGYPSSILSLGDSASTGYNSDFPGRDAPENSWAIGTNPAVDSQYSRILAANPRIAGHSTSFARDGAPSADLRTQAQLPPGTHVDYVTIEIGGNDFCHATAAGDTPPPVFRANIVAGLRVIAREAPSARIFVGSFAFGTESTWDPLAPIPAARAALSDGSECDPGFDASNVPNPQRRAYVNGLVATYNAQLESACSLFIHCRWDGGALTNIPPNAANFSTHDWGHPSIAGEAAMAAARLAGDVRLHRPLGAGLEGVGGENEDGQACDAQRDRPAGRARHRVPRRQSRVEALRRAGRRAQGEAPHLARSRRERELRSHTLAPRLRRREPVTSRTSRRKAARRAAAAQAGRRSAVGRRAKPDLSGHAIGLLLREVGHDHSLPGPPSGATGPRQFAD